MERNIYFAFQNPFRGAQFQKISQTCLLSHLQNIRFTCFSRSINGKELVQTVTAPEGKSKINHLGLIQITPLQPLQVDGPIYPKQILVQ